MLGPRSKVGVVVRFEKPQYCVRSTEKVLYKLRVVLLHKNSKGNRICTTLGLESHSGEANTPASMIHQAAGYIHISPSSIQSESTQPLFSGCSILPSCRHPSAERPGYNLCACHWPI